MHVQFDQGLIKPQRDKVVEMYHRFHVEHLNPIAFENVNPATVRFCNPATVHLEYMFDFTSRQDYRVRQEVVRYFETCIVPTVLFDESPLKVEQHDWSGSGDCQTCNEYWGRLTVVDINSTTLAHTAYINEYGA